jgi:hypothetical protein
MASSHRLLPLAAAALVALAAASPAHGSSIAYVKDGDVWLSSPDGQSRYQVTTGRGWRSPSQADDGTLLAQRGNEFVRMDRSGRVLSVNEGVGGDVALPAGWADGHDRVYGPYDPKLSPDGRTIAYWFRTERNDGTPGDPGEAGTLDAWTTSQPVGESLLAVPWNSVRGPRAPAWIDSRRVIATATYADGGLSVSTWVAGGDHKNEQWWFTDPNAILQDAELSPDRTKAVAVAATHGAGSPFDGVRYYVANGPAWTHEPPYENVFGGDDFPEPPTPVCQDTRDSAAESPTWSPDSRAVAYADKDGIWIQPVRADLDATNCASLASTLLLPGGREPDWGPADVDMDDAPRPGGGATVPDGAPAADGGAAPAPGGGVVPAASARLSALKATRRGRAVRIAFRLDAPAAVRLVLRRGRSVRRVSVRGRAGTNVTVVRGLGRGRWRIAATAGATTLRASVRVR